MRAGSLWFVTVKTNGGAGELVVRSNCQSNRFVEVKTVSSGPAGPAIARFNVPPVPETMELIDGRPLKGFTVTVNGFVEFAWPDKRTPGNQRVG